MGGTVPATDHAGGMAVEAGRRRWWWWWRITGSRQEVEWGEEKVIKKILSPLLHHHPTATVEVVPAGDGSARVRIGF